MLNNIITTVNLSKENLPRRKFEQIHLDSSIVFVDPKTYPNRYRPQDLENGLKFHKRELIDLDLIVERVHSFTKTAQGPRVTIAGNIKETEFSIKQRGYMLTNPPAAVLRLPNGKYMWLDGRSRKYICESKLKDPMKNMIFDVYEEDRENYPDELQSFFNQAAHRFSIRMNANERPASPFTTDDLIRHVVYSYQQNWIKGDIQSILNEVEKVNSNQFQPSQVNKIAMRVQKLISEFDNDIKPCESWSDPMAKNWLKDEAKHQDNNNNNGIYYTTYSYSTISKSISVIAKRYQDKVLECITNNLPLPKEYRLIIHTGVLKASNPEQSWKDSIDDFRTEFKDKLNNVSKAFFEDEISKSKIVLYGAIPSCWSLADEFPMNKIVKFNQGPLKNKLFKDIANENNLETDVFTYLDKKEDDYFGNSQMLGDMGLDLHMARRTN